MWLHITYGLIGIGAFWNYVENRDLRAANKILEGTVDKCLGVTEGYEAVTEGYKAHSEAQATRIGELQMLLGIKEAVEGKGAEVTVTEESHPSCDPPCDAHRESTGQ